MEFSIENCEQLSVIGWGYENWELDQKQAEFILASCIKYGFNIQLIQIRISLLAIQQQQKIEKKVTRALHASGREVESMKWKIDKA